MEGRPLQAGVFRLPWVLALLPSHCVTSGKLLPGPQFPHLPNGENLGLALRIKPVFPDGLASPQALLWGPSVLLWGPSEGRGLPETGWGRLDLQRLEPRSGCLPYSIWTRMIFKMCHSQE